jgi:transposase
MYPSLYLGLDAHTRVCVLAAMDPFGHVTSTKTFSTSEAALIRHVIELPARAKYLVLEESSLAGWIASALRPYVTKLIVCDPRHNLLISRGNKDDRRDAADLCRLLRLGELVEVFHSDHEHRTDFKIAVQQYLRFTRDRASLKSQIKSKYHQAGVVHVGGTQVFTKRHRASHLRELPTNARRAIMENLYEQLDALNALWKSARSSMVELGKRYPEIAEFQRVPGIGVVGSHVFDAFIQTPHRFANKRKLWKYCRLGIRQRSSAGKPLAFRRLDRSGAGALKALSHQCWMSATKTKNPNEVSLFFEASLHCTGDPVHARLNTQRKVLAVIWTIWKKGLAYDPKLFYSPPASTVTA